MDPRKLKIGRVVGISEGTRTGTARPPVIDEVKPDKITEATEVWTPGTDPKWSSKATVEDQLISEKHIGTHRMGPITARQFDFGDQEQVKAYNEHMALCSPEGAPSLVVERQKEDFCKKTGNFKVLLFFRRVEYMVLIKRPLPPPDNEVKSEETQSK